MRRTLLEEYTNCPKTLKVARFSFDKRSTKNNTGAKDLEHVSDLVHISHIISSPALDI